MVKLPDLFVYPVISGEGESGVDERNAADSLEIYRCPVFTNRVSLISIGCSWA